MPLHEMARAMNASPSPLSPPSLRHGKGAVRCSRRVDAKSTAPARVDSEKPKKAAIYCNRVALDGSKIAVWPRENGE
eukprot:7377893-Prymnesium_polylepis.1